jgi:hypothetical protein
VRSIPHLNGLQAKFGQKGLVLLTFHSQQATEAELNTFIKDHKIIYPVSSGGGSSFTGGRGIPIGWLIGVEGKVIWQGNPAGESGRVDKLIEDEIRKIKYPGLGKLDVDARVAGAATAFSARQYDKARTDAGKLLERAGVTAAQVTEAGEDAKTIKVGEGDDAKEVELNAMLRDAAFVVRRVEETYAGMKSSAEAFEAKKDYLDAQNIWQDIMNTFGRRSTEGAAADEKIKEYRRDREIQKEIRAQAELVTLLTRLANANDEIRKTQLEAYIKKHEGTRAAEKAQAEIK